MKTRGLDLDKKRQRCHSYPLRILKIEIWGKFLFLKKIDMCTIEYLNCYFGRVIKKEDLIAKQLLNFGDL